VFLCDVWVLCMCMYGVCVVIVVCEFVCCLCLWGVYVFVGLV